MPGTRPAQPSGGRTRNAAVSRERLVAAAKELFAANGYDRTNIRDIGAQAGVDPTLIARYFGGKAQLYIAALNAGTEDQEIADVLDPERMAWILRTTRERTNPIYQVAVRPHGDPAGQEATRRELHRRVVEPLRRRLLRDGVADAELRAEVLAAAFVGVVLARTSGAFDHLPGVPDDELQELLLDLLSPR